MKPSVGSTQIIITMATILLSFLHNLPFITPQQDYIRNRQLDCFSEAPSITKGYSCNGIRTGQCQYFTTFQSFPPDYETPISIALLLGSEPSTIASINNISSTSTKIPPGTWIIVPVSCSCFGSIYQHNSPYTVRALDETYFTIANNTFQGLTTCQALAGQNYYYSIEQLRIGFELNVPLKCACPSEKQAATGVVSLLGYMVTWGDTIPLIADRFGVDSARIMEANRFENDSVIFPFTQLLVPLDSQSCEANPDGFFCSCSVNPGIFSFRDSLCNLSLLGKQLILNPNNLKDIKMSASIVVLRSLQAEEIPITTLKFGYLSQLLLHQELVIEKLFLSGKTSNTWCSPPSDCNGDPKLVTPSTLP